MRGDSYTTPVYFKFHRGGMVAVPGSHGRTRHANQNASNTIAVPDAETAGDNDGRSNPSTGSSSKYSTMLGKVIILRHLLPNASSNAKEHQEYRVPLCTTPCTLPRATPFGQFLCYTSAQTQPDPNQYAGHILAPPPATSACL